MWLHPNASAAAHDLAWPMAGSAQTSRNSNVRRMHTAMRRQTCNCSSDRIHDKSWCCLFSCLLLVDLVAPGLCIPQLYKVGIGNELNLQRSSCKADFPRLRHCDSVSYQIVRSGPTTRWSQLSICRECALTSLRVAVTAVAIEQLHRDEPHARNWKLENME